mmetsp:Transcript_45318/g.140740  ORF Transcript_45318/g.140740 Transcript_45318/m.140740 type:complete len:203 (+) Transcript_45318:1513-2121(+)
MVRELVLQLLAKVGTPATLPEQLLALAQEHLAVEAHPSLEERRRVRLHLLHALPVGAPDGPVPLLPRARLSAPAGPGLLGAGEAGDRPLDDGVDLRNRRRPELLLLHRGRDPGPELLQARLLQPDGMLILLYLGEGHRLDLPPRDVLDTGNGRVARQVGPDFGLLTDRPERGQPLRASMKGGKRSRCPVCKKHNQKQRPRRR